MLHVVLYGFGSGYGWRIITLCGSYIPVHVFCFMQYSLSDNYCSSLANPHLQHHGLFQAKQSKSPIVLGPAERKILISFCTYLLISVNGIITYTLLTRDAENLERELENYFTCEALGSNPAMPCDRDAYLEFSYPGLIALASSLSVLFPLFNLIYVVDCEELKKLFGQLSSIVSKKSIAMSTTDV